MHWFSPLSTPNSNGVTAEVQNLQLLLASVAPQVAAHSWTFAWEI
jgi:hypothetical protein